ncbi:MAG TPA: ATP-binding protein [Syntrophobacteraceae bacterium]|nr:ATP-binding protein [Syntrophobacteraceae bacterium]
MSGRKSLKNSILYYCWALVLAGVLPCGYLYHLLSRTAVEDAQGMALRELDLVERLLTDAAPFPKVEDLQDRVTRAAKQRGVRISYVAEDGRVLADSMTDPDRISDLENFAGRAEILDARSGAPGVSFRYSQAVKKEMAFAAKKTALLEGHPPGFLRLAMDPPSIQGQLDRFIQAVPLYLFLLCAVVALSVPLVVRRFDGILSEMTRAVDSLGSGRPARRVHLEPGHELSPLALSLQQCAERLEDRLASTNEERRRLEAVFEGMREGVIVLDSRGRIRSVNRALANLVPRTPSPVGRKPIEVIMNLELQEACHAALSPDRPSNESFRRLELVLWRERSYTVTISRLPPTRDEGEDEIPGAIVVFHDITEIKRLEKVRQDFVANVSHELRTPLTSVKGYTETLLSEEMPDRQTLASFLQVILKNTNHMVKIVDDLLELARLEALQFPVRPVPVHAGTALHAAWKACLPLASAREISLQNDLPPHGPWVLAVPDQLVQVFRNLIENAVRYNPASKPIVVSCEEQEETVTFRVRDFGPGIPKEHQDRIFERFYRVEKHRAGEAGSTGLGLAICRHILRNLGGRVWVCDPSPGRQEGAAFCFTLLRAPAEANRREG